jgi:hypothetical protein
MSVVTICQACGGRDVDEDGIPRCRHFRHNLRVGYAGPQALNRLSAWFVSRGLRPPWWPR